MPAVSLSDQATQIQELFTNTQFDIRPPQRRYKWRAQQVEQFWNDIVNAHSQGASWYFLGSLLLQPDRNGGPASVIDGQQRLTTMMLVLAVMRDTCQQLGGTQTRFETNFNCIRPRDNDGNPVGRLTLKLQNPDDRVLQIMAGEEGSTNSERPAEASSSDRIFDAITTLKEKMRVFMIGNNGDVNAFSDLNEFILRSVKLLPLEVVDEAQAYLIFDTTNTRGLSLTPSEQLKARLAVVVREDERRASNLIDGWDRVAVAIEGSGLPVDAMDDYLIAVWATRSGSKTTKRQIANVITKSIDDGLLSPEELVEDMLDYVQEYIRIAHPTGRGRVDEDLRDLRRLSFTQGQAFLMAVGHHGSNDDFNRALSAALSLQVRNITFGLHRANEYEVLWPEWAKLARSNRLEEVLVQIGRELDSDSDFERNFVRSQIRSDGAATHILRKLEEFIHPRTGVQLIENDLDHLLPRSVSGKLLRGTRLTRNTRQWIEDLGYEIPTSEEVSKDLGRKLENATYSIGNLALLDLRLNRGQRDAAFDAKRANLQGMGVELTRSVGLRNRWNEREIRHRAEELAESAVSVWKV